MTIAQTNGADEIVGFLQSNRQILDVCRTPINAMIVAALYINKCPLPHSRADIYEQRFQLLLGRWDRARAVPLRTQISPTDKMRFLTRIAMHLHQRHRRSFTPREAGEVWRNGFQRFYPGRTITDVLQEMRFADNVLCRDSVGEYSLGHLSYQEFLTAKGIVAGQQIDILAENFYDPWWREVSLFYAGISGDISKLLAAIQTRVGLSGHRGLVDEMMQEARYTSEVARIALRDIENDGFLGR